MQDKIKKQNFLKIIFFTFFCIIFVPKAFAIEQILSVIETPVFSDIKNDYWANYEISELYKRGIINGYPDETFRPLNNITRAEFITMVVNALDISDNDVVFPIEFKDVYDDDWFYNSIQNAYYFQLLELPPGIKKEAYFYPKKLILREHAISMAVNALETSSVTQTKARAVLKMYKDVNNLPDTFLTVAAKAEMLDMLAINPDRKNLIDAQRPITRAEAAVLIYNMIQQASENCNEKIANYLFTKTSENGYVITDSYLENDTVAVIPKYTVLKLVAKNVINSQKLKKGDSFEIVVPKDFINASRNLLLPRNTVFKGELKTVKKSIIFIRNAEIEFYGNTVKIPNQDESAIKSFAKLKPQNTNKLLNKVLKGEKIKIDNFQFLNVELLQDLKIYLPDVRIIE